MFENPETAFGGARELLSLIELIYSAVNEPALWQLVMDELATVLEGEATALFTRFPKDSIVALTRFEPGAWEEFAEYYSSVNVMMVRSDAIFPDGAVRNSHVVISDKELEHTEFYHDYFRRYNMYYASGVKIPLGELPAAFISSQRPKSKGPFGERESLVFTTLMPHLRRSLKLHQQFSLAAAREQGLSHALDALEHAVLGVNADCKVLLSNRRAEMILHAGDGLRLVQGQLFAETPLLSRQLQSLLSNAVRLIGGIPSGGSMLLPRRSGEVPLRLVISPFFGTLPGSRVVVSALLFVSDPSAGPASRDALMRSIFGLTPTEGRLADLLLQGKEIREAATHLGTTVETTRFHVKRIFSKTGVRRQSELIRLLLSLPGLG